MQHILATTRDLHASCSPCICSRQCQKLPGISQQPHRKPPSYPALLHACLSTQQDYQLMQLQNVLNRPFTQAWIRTRQVCYHSCACHDQACGTHTVPQPAHKQHKEWHYTKPHAPMPRLNTGVGSSRPTDMHSQLQVQRDCIQQCGRELFLHIALQDAPSSVPYTSDPASLG